MLILFTLPLLVLCICLFNGSHGADSCDDIDFVDELLFIDQLEGRKK